MVLYVPQFLDQSLVNVVVTYIEGLQGHSRGLSVKPSTENTNISVKKCVAAIKIAWSFFAVNCTEHTRVSHPCWYVTTEAKHALVLSQALTLWISLKSWFIICCGRRVVHAQQQNVMWATKWILTVSITGIGPILSEAMYQRSFISLEHSLYQRIQLLCVHADRANQARGG